MATNIVGATGIDKVQDGTIVNADINASAAIATSKLTGITLAGLTDTTVSTSDPAITTNPSSGVGHVWINRTSGESYVLSDATTNENVWKNIGPGTGDVEPVTYVTATGPDSAAGVTDGDYKYHIFNTTKTGSAGFVVSSAGDASTSNTVEYLVVAGGGGAQSYYRNGGGGAGGYRASWYNEASGGGASSQSAVTPTVGNHSITVGAGGAGGIYNGVDASQGSASSFAMGVGVSTVGGGAGASHTDAGTTGGSGGGGGGGAAGLAGTANEGYAGGDGVGTSQNQRGGGGGGAAAAGQNGAADSGGNGGVGVASTITGSSVYRAGGGGGGSFDGGGGTGGNGGGANGSNYSSSAPGTAGTVNTGGGGGGGGYSSTYPGGAGGSGVVILRYKFQN